MFANVFQAILHLHLVSLLSAASKETASDIDKVNSRRFCLAWKSQFIIDWIQNCALFRGCIVFISDNINTLLVDAKIKAGNFSSNVLLLMYSMFLCMYCLLLTLIVQDILK
jgi:hypothetical protein